MTIYILEIILLALQPLFASKIKNKNNRKKFVCIASFLILLFVMGFRHEKIGMYDTEYVYHPQFNKVQYLSWNEVFGIYPIERGVLFPLFMKCFTLISTDYNLWIFVSSIPILLSFCYLVYKFSSNSISASFCFFLFVVLRIYTTCFYIQRASFAMAFCILAFIAATERNLFKYIIFSAIAVAIHTSAIVFFPVYFLIRNKVSKKHIIVFLLLFFIILYNGKDIINNIYIHMGDSNYYVHYNETRFGFKNNVQITIYFMFYVTLIMLKKIEKNEDKIVQYSINMIGMAVLFMVLSLFMQEFYRMSFFYIICALPALTNIVYGLKDRNIIYMYVFIVSNLLLVFYMQALTNPDTMLIPYESWIFD